MADAVSKAIEILNEALRRDRAAITELVNLRVECNRDLSDHPLIQVGRYEGVYRIGFLGLMNGLLGDSPTGVIGAEGLADERSGRFKSIRRFVDLRNEKLDVLA
ncbi:MAG: hypothetical protein ACPGOV_16420 [Magnetovibrionaceae bacterium]